MKAPKGTPSFLRGLTEWHGERVVGWRTLTTYDKEEAACDLGCLAPGSSPHWHATLTGYQLATSNGLYEFDLDGMCLVASALFSTEGK